MPSQFLTLLLKSARLRRRAMAGTVCELLFPLVMFLLLVFMYSQTLSSVSLSGEYNKATYERLPMTPLSRVSTNGRHLLYQPKGIGVVDGIVSRVALRLPEGTKVIGLSDENALINYYWANVSQVWMGLSFRLTSEQANQNELFVHSSPNETASVVIFTDPFRNPSTRTQYSTVDVLKKSNAERYLSMGTVPMINELSLLIVNEAAGGGGKIQVNMDTQRFPVKGSPFPPPPPEFIARLSTEAMAGLFYGLALLFSAYQLVADLVSEKASRMRETCQIMGMKVIPYWSSWGVTTLLFASLPALLNAFLLKVAVTPAADGEIIFGTSVLYICSVISLCFLVSVFFSDSKLAAPAVALIVLGGSVLSAVVNMSAIGVAGGLGYSLLSPLCFGLGIRLTILADVGSGGMTAAFLAQGTTGTSFALWHCMVMLGVDTVLYCLLAFYFDAVLPSEYGTHRHPLFLCLPSYWRDMYGCQKQGGVSTLQPFAESGKAGSKLEGSTRDSELLPTLRHAPSSFLRNPDIEICAPDEEAAICVRGLRKEFSNGVTAVDGLHLDVFAGQILSLLGHNGAGKTTTISMLTGLTPVTAGEARFEGLSITRNMSQIRKSVGLCPQHDVLYDPFTVREHLFFFAALKGVARAEAPAQVEAIMDQLKLSASADTPARALSGGLKRKLSVGIALIGGSRYVFLDEPSSGMDPMARRELWKVLIQHKAGRVMVLTTHYMDEADELGDRVAVLSKGRLRCAGTPVFLKDRFGTGYILTASKTGECNVSKVTAAIQRHVMEATLRTDIGSELSYRLPIQYLSPFPGLMKELEESRESLGIESLGVAMTTLMDVYLRVTDQTESTAPELVSGEEDNEDGTGVEAEGPGSSPAVMAPIPPLAENTTGASEMAASMDTAEVDKVAHEVRELLDTTPSHPNVLQQVRALLARRAIEASREPVFQIVLILFLLLCIVLAFLLRSEYFVASSTLPVLPLLFSSLPAYSSTPYEYESAVTGTSAQAFIESMPAVSFARFYNISAGVNLTEWVRALNSAPTTPAALQIACLNVTSPGVGEFSFNLLFNPVVVHSLPIFVQQLCNGVLHRAVSSNFTLSTQLRPFPPGPLNHALNNLGMINVVGILFALGTAFVTCAAARTIVKDRVDGFKYILLTHGTSKLAYWLSNGLWDGGVFGLVMALVSLVAIGVGGAVVRAGPQPLAEPFQLGDEGVLFVMLLLSGFSMTLFVYLLAWLFSRPTVAHGGLSMLFFFVTIFSMMPFQSYENNITDPTVMVIDVIMSALSPINALAIGVVKAADMLGMRSAIGLSPGTSLFHWRLLGVNMCILVIQFVVYMLILFVVDGWDVLVGAMGKRTVPPSSLETDEITAATSRISVQLGPLSDGVEAPRGELGSIGDSDVRQERQRILQQFRLAAKAGDGDAMQMVGLRKEFGSPEELNFKLAVNSLFLGVPEGELFGLLGHNGAGKTTAIRVVTGDISGSGGAVFVCGHNVATQLNDARQYMGLCPQFDVLIGAMTGREHLYVFARLHGVSEKIIDRVVEGLLSQVGIQQYADQPSRQWSGGNRRKLSLALALVGNPNVLLLDEPTCGMDPASRRHTWNVISVALPGRAVILTTHSMEECEALCTRIGIMRAGQLVCIGGPQHLKGKYGQHYDLEVALPVDEKREGEKIGEKEMKSDEGESVPAPHTVAPTSTTMAALEESVQTLFPDAVCQHDSRVGNSLTFTLPQANVKLSDAFAALEQARKDGAIGAYTLNQPTMEQIFLRLAKQEDEEMEEEDGRPGPQARWSDLFIAYLWWAVSVVLFGAHHFWLGNYRRAFLYLFTFNLLEIGWLIDLLLLPRHVEKSVRRYGSVGCCCCYQRARCRAGAGGGCCHGCRVCCCGGGESL